MSEPVRSVRIEPADVRELRRLKQSQPRLASAADMQIELLELQYRVQARVPLPRLPGGAARDERLRRGKAILRFADVPLDWSDFRLMLHRTADVLRRHGSLSEVDARGIDRLARAAASLEPLAQRWFDGDADAGVEGPLLDGPSAEVLDPVIQLSMRPFLVRCAEVALVELDLSAWTRGVCPLCGGEAEFGLIGPDASMRLACGRCTGLWTFEALRCAFCDNRDRVRLTTFASMDRAYRVTGCDVCRRYLKVLDQRSVNRPLLLGYDAIATLPLDAAAMQKGYAG